MNRRPRPGDYKHVGAARACSGLSNPSQAGGLDSCRDSWRHSFTLNRAH